MLVSNTTLELAMRRVLEHLGAVPGRLIPYGAIEHEWEETGLRTADLRDTVRMLLGHGDLVCDERHEGLAFQLTGRGYQHFFEPRVPFERMATYPDDCDALELARRRPRDQPFPVDLLRRVDDLETHA